MRNKPASQDPIQTIPDPGIVLECLAESLRQTRLLRHLLRVSERAASDCKRAEDARAGTGVKP